jgi:hypothetical protein
VKTVIIDSVKYNLLRSALVENAEEEHDIIEIRPKKFALKKEHNEEVLAAAMEILQDKRIAKGITPYDTMKTFQKDNQELTPEVTLYVLMCYAVAVQQEWITYSTILNKFYVNLSHKDARQYVEDTHKTLLN